MHSEHVCMQTQQVVSASMKVALNLAHSAVPGSEFAAAVSAAIICLGVLAREGCAAVARMPPGQLSGDRGVLYSNKCRKCMPLLLCSMSV